MTTLGNAADRESIAAKADAVMQAHERWIWERTVRPLVTDQIIKEHREQPFGKHSLALDRVLGFLRRDPDKDLPRYVSVMTVPGHEWRIGTHPRVRGRPFTILDDETFDSEEDVEHAVFLRRLHDRDVRLG